jgi:hypothetical protein
VCSLSRERGKIPSDRINESGALALARARPEIRRGFFNQWGFLVGNKRKWGFWGKRWERRDSPEKTDSSFISVRHKNRMART